MPRSSSIYRVTTISPPVLGEFLKKPVSGKRIANPNYSATSSASPPQAVLACEKELTYYQASGFLC